MNRGYTMKIPVLKILSDGEVEAIHKATLEVMEETGLYVDHEEGLHIFEDGGCDVDYDTKRVRIPDWLVEESIRKTPSSTIITPRDPANTLRIGGNEIMFASGADRDIVDPVTGDSRTPTQKEQDDAVRLCDALENVHFLMYGPYHSGVGVPPATTLIWHTMSRIRNTTKVMMSGSMFDCDLWNIKMAKASNQMLLGSVMPSPPLTLYHDAVAAAIRFANEGWPVWMPSGAVYGGTGPASMAGSTITNNVEILAVVVLMQLIHPGVGCITMNFTHPLDMRTGNVLFGTPSEAVHSLAHVQMFRHYGIPTGCGTATNAKPLDCQTCYETGMQTLMYALAGCNVTWVLGNQCAELAFSPEMAVMHDDICGWIGHILEGIQVNEESIAADLIKEVGPIPGEFLTSAHTRKWWKIETFMPKAADWTTYPGWEAIGKKTCVDLASERVKRILATHEVPPLPEDQDKELDEIFEEALQYYLKRELVSEQDIEAYHSRRTGYE